MNLNLNSKEVQNHGLAAREATEFPLELIRRALTTKSSTISVYTTRPAHSARHTGFSEMSDKQDTTWLTLGY